MTTEMQRRKRKDGSNFYCPNGHIQHYSESELERLRKKLDEQTRVATQQAERAARAEQAEHRSANKNEST